MRLASWAAVVMPVGLAVLVKSTYTVCSPTSCSNVSSTAYTQLTLGARLPNANVLLLPGTYTIPLPAGMLDNSTSPVDSSNLSNLGPLYNLTAFQNYTVSTRVSPFSLTLFPAQGAIFYSSSIGTGITQLVQTGAPVEQNQTIETGSWVLGKNVWTKLRVDDQEFVSWDSVGHIKQLPLLTATGKSGIRLVEVLDTQSSACNITCSSGGSCVSLSPAGENSACVCRSGFTGSLCDLCSPGHFGKDCQDCATSCASGVCSDGLNGTGKCVVSASNSTATCYCLNGECQGTSLSSSCTCSAGWTSPTITSSAPSYNLTNLQCSTCAAGFILSDNQCVACPKNATSCKSSSVATACVDGWEVELGECVRASGPSGKGSVCDGNNYWSTSSKMCEPCSPLCDGCFAADQNSCLACPGSKKLLRATCVSVDETTGVCQDTDSPVVKGGFYYDSSKGECDSCPSKSLSCAIPRFNVSTSTRSQVVETSCMSGWALSVEGKCVESCPNGEFVNDVGANMTCSVCDTSCGTCQYSSSYCLTCPSNSSKVAYNGSCTLTSCPDATILSNGVCSNCHPDCASCSGSAVNQCTACPADRPILKDGRCLVVCDQAAYFNSTLNSCEPCDASCGSCLGPSSSQCFSCSSSTSIVSSGRCVNSTCPTSLVPFLHICLSDLTAVASGMSDKHKILSISLPIILACLLIALLSIWFYIRRERRKTRQATLRFAEGLDDVQVDKQKRKIGVENVLRVMRQARQTMEDRWAGRDQRSEERKGVKKGLLGKNLKPLRLETGWRNQVGSKKHGRRNHPPPYTPLPTDTIFLSDVSSSQPSNGHHHSQGSFGNDSRYILDSPTEARFIIDSSSPTISNHAIDSPRGSLTSRYTFESDRPESRYISIEPSHPYSSRQRGNTNSQSLKKTRKLEGSGPEYRIAEDEGLPASSPAYRVSDFIDLYLRQLEPMPMPTPGPATISTPRFKTKSDIVPPVPALFRDHLPPPHAPITNAPKNKTNPSTGPKNIPRKPFGPSPTKSKTTPLATSTSKFIEGDDSECGWCPEDDHPIVNMKPVLNHPHPYPQSARSPVHSGHHTLIGLSSKGTNWMPNEKNEGGREDLSITFGRTDVSSASALISGFGTGWDGPDDAATVRPIVGSNNPFRSAR